MVMSSWDFTRRPVVMGLVPANRPFVSSLSESVSLWPHCGARFADNGERPAHKISSPRGEIALLTPTNRRNGEHDLGHVDHWGIVMSISEYLAATALVAVI